MWEKLFGEKADPVEIQHIPDEIGLSGCEIPQLPVKIDLDADEVCSFSIPAQWARREKSHRTFRGGGLSVRVASGVYLRGIGGQSAPKEAVETISEGRLYVTNKRLVFHGTSKSTTLELAATPDHDGVHR